jgi:hypothetical protein
MCYSSSVLLCCHGNRSNYQVTVWFSKHLQISISVSLETVFRHQLVSKKQSLRGNVFAIRFLGTVKMSQYCWKILIRIKFQVPEISGVGVSLPTQIF